MNLLTVCLLICLLTGINIIIIATAILVGAVK